MRWANIGSTFIPLAHDHLSISQAHNISPVNVKEHTITTKWYDDNNNNNAQAVC